MQLTLFGRSVALLSCLILANATCWTVAGILFGRTSNTQPILPLALLAWTLGLRHGMLWMQITLGFLIFQFLCDSLNAAIDNATRGLINLGQLPVTCGLFFSLGHSTIVIVVNVAIAISSSIYDKLNGVGTVGGIVGPAVSGSFLFIVGVANSVILWRIITQRRRVKKMQEQGVPIPTPEPHHNHMLMMRIIGPIITFVNKPWKMYPVGVLFGFGFDTASSIALLAISALGRKGSDGSSIPSGDIVILPLLFTAGMSLVDSADSVLMLYSYAGFPERSWTITLPALGKDEQNALPTEKNVIFERPNTSIRANLAGEPIHRSSPDPALAVPDEEPPTSDEKSAHLQNNLDRDLRVKLNVMSGLSIVLTLMSILVAFSISLITIMGLIGDQCKRCQEAANAADGGGLAGSWWRGWATANDNSGYIGAAIVGGFLVVVVFWYASRRISRRTAPPPEEIRAV